MTHFAQSDSHEWRSDWGEFVIQPCNTPVRPAGVLTDLFGDSEMGEDQLLLRLREVGLIAYPSPLLRPLREEWPDVLAVEVLARLHPTDLVVFGQAARACRAAVVAFGVPQEEVETSDNSDDEGTGGGDEGIEGGPLLLRVQDFVGSVERLAWARARGCPWDTRICQVAAEDGHLEVLKWAWERRCPLSAPTCGCACTPPRAGTWMCCGGRGSTGATGTIKRVCTPRGEGTWGC